MLIGHIDYLNLLPFYQFLKKKGIKTKKSYPAEINRWFEKGEIEAAFISSVEAKNRKCLDAGIAVKKRAKSVLVCPGEGDDAESATSNVLAKVLGIQGRVVIGDKAFREKNCTDLAAVWHERYALPFVFAVFCANTKTKEYEKLIKGFLRKKEKIPYMVLKKYAEKTGISVKEAREYLNEIIYYRLGWREKKALKRFWDLARKIR